MEEQNFNFLFFFSFFQVTFDKVGRKKECVVFSKEGERARERERERAREGGGAKAEINGT